MENGGDGIVMRIEQRLLKRVGPSPRTVARRKEPVLSHLVSKVAVALAEIEAILRSDVKGRVVLRHQVSTA